MKLKKLAALFSWRAIVAGILAGGIIHIVVTFAIPYVSTTSAFMRISAAIPVNKLTIAPIASAGAGAGSQLMRFMTPDVRYALCRYDIARGPVRISARLLDPSWTLALYTPQGDNFHTTTGLASRRNDVSFDLVPPVPKFLGLFPTSSVAATERITVNVPQKIGLMVLRAPINGTAFTEEVDNTLKLASCRPIEQ